MLHAPNTCVHECMRTCKPGPIWPMLLAKPANSLHERMHASTNMYKLLISINISTRNMNLKICAPREACARQPCGSPDMLSRVRMHAWTCLMAQIINIYMRRLVPGAGCGPVGLAGYKRDPIGRGRSTIWGEGIPSRWEGYQIWDLRQMGPFCVLKPHYPC